MRRWPLYRRITDHLQGSKAELCTIISVLPLKPRKAFVLMCRARRNPYHDRKSNTTLWRLSQPFWNYLTQHKYPQLRIVSILDECITRPMIAGFMLSLCVSSPMARSEAESIVVDMYEKEIRSMESIRRDGTIDWHSLMTRPDYQLNPGFSNRRVSSTIHYQLKSWVDKISSKIIYPHSGVKMLATGSASTLGGDPSLSLDNCSTRQAESKYSRYGVLGEGPCEMKQRWVPGSLVPRTYYAQGLTAYHSSKYLRNAFNDLADLFRNINKFKRVLPQTAASESFDSTELYIYDLTSFTSLFHEHRNFLLDLADVVQEVEVILADSHYGKTTAMLSELIREYVTCNVSDPTYVSSVLDPERFLYLTHGVAGFLGVYANLITCTIPHGWTLACIDDSFSNNWCAGDDAGIQTAREKLDILNKNCRRLGQIQEEKTFVGTEPGAVALKRPVRLEHNIIVFSPNVLWPIFGPIFDQEGTRFSDEDYKMFRFRFCSSLISFFSSTRTMDLETEEVLFAVGYLKHVYDVLGLPLRGWFPVLMGWSPWKFTVPIMDERFFDLDPLERLVDTFYTGSFETTMEEEMPADIISLLEEGYSQGNMTPGLRWLRDIGYVHATEVRVKLYDLDGRECVLNSVRRKSNRVRGFPKVYDFHLIDTVPKNLIPLV
jgi:hypothetical protein